MRPEKEIKGIQIWKKKTKLLIFADDMTVHLENHKKFTKQKKILIISEFSKVIEYTFTTSLY